MKPATKMDPLTLGGRVPGEVVELAAITPYGGTMRGRTLAAGTRVRVAWQQPAKAPEATFVDVFDEFEERFTHANPVACSASARISRVIDRRETSDAPDDGRGGDDDPLRRGVDNLPLLETRR
jgi:hypothetical protein